MEAFKIPLSPLITAPLINDSKKSVETPGPESSTEAPQTIETSESVCPYKVPSWSGTADAAKSYKFEVLKSGQIIEEIEELQSMAVWRIGRVPGNDIQMAHPTISRFHAVLQYRPTVNVEEGEKGVREMREGWYIYDLGSTHGTFLNKQRIPSKTFIPIRVGHMLRLGASTRNYILQGPAEDEEPESELSVTELRAQRQQREEEEELERQRQIEAREKEGISWGMSEDADEEADLSVNPYASTNNEELYLQDPKRTLRGYFEREGLELEYKCDEMAAGSFVCRVELPLDDTNGRPIVAEVIHKGRKKECVVQCALEACRILDRYGVLRQANQEPLKRKKLSKSDDDDDDDFLDRTGDVERKKLRKAHDNTTIALTYEDLIKQDAEVLTNITTVENEIRQQQVMHKRQKDSKAQDDAGDSDLDTFMERLSEHGNELDKTEIRKLRIKHQNLQQEHQRLQRLIKITKPVQFSFGLSKSIKPVAATTKLATGSKPLPMIGKRMQFSKLKVAKLLPRKPLPVDTSKPEEEEEEEDEDEEEMAESGQIPNEKLNEKEEDIKKNDGKEHISGNEEGEYSTLPFGHENLEEDSERSTVNNCKSKVSKDEKNEGSIDGDPSAEAVNAKKRRSRLRMRSRRTDVDINELAEHESDEKYSRWVPPENQTGDGITALNKKFGY